MDSLPPDPYAALGVAKDATAGAIKSQYRKLVLKLHPDKVQDEALKQAAVDEFHKVQTAYEIVGDDDRRQRYDAQCKLEQLRRDVMERGGGGARGASDVRTAGFKVPTDSPRGGDFYARGPERSGPMSPQYEERRPSYPEYFDAPRATSRKNSDFERSSKRAPPRDEPKKSRTSTKKSKENEHKSREEKSRRTDQEMRKDRERKYAYVSEESPTSDSDDHERARRQRREEEEIRRVRAAAMEEDARRRREEEAAAASFFGNERAHKLYTQDINAREYMARGATSPHSPQERSPMDNRPSPVRAASSRENVEYIRRDDGKPPVMIRRGSGRPDSSRRDTRSRDKNIELVDEPQEMPRKPTLTKMQSSPPEIRSSWERQRSNSLQFDPREAAPVPGIKRAETMPYHSGSSKLRTEIRDGYPTPEASPEPPSTRKYSYGQIYADDGEYPTPDGYRTEVREPTASRKAPRSPSPRRSPVRETREKPRSTSAKYATQPPPPKRTTSTTYVYPCPPEPVPTEVRRPSLPRENSGRLFGELETTRSPKPSQKYSPPPEEIKFAPKPRAEDIKTATGYKVRPRQDRAYSSRHATPVPAR